MEVLLPIWPNFLFLVLHFSNNCHSFCKIHEYIWIEWPPITYIQIFFAIISVAKCPLVTPCNSFKTICASEVVEHICILYCPILYIIPSFKGKGFTFLANSCFWVRFFWHLTYLHVAIHILHSYRFYKK